MDTVHRGHGLSRYYWSGQDATSMQLQKGLAPSMDLDCHLESAQFLFATDSAESVVVFARTELPGNGLLTATVELTRPCPAKGGQYSGSMIPRRRLDHSHSVSDAVPQ
jgi:hypothetical protein